MAEARIPPHSDEAEKSIIGACLIDKDAIVAVAEFLRPEHFYDEKHACIFRAILSLYEERSPVDIVTLTEKLKKQKDLTRIGGAAFLSELASLVPTAGNVEEYGRIVKDNYTKRQLISAASKITEQAFDEGSEATGVLDQAEQQVFALSQAHLKQVFLPVKDALAESFDRLDELHKKAGGLRGLPSGFKDLDNMLAGFQQSNLIILAARPGLGKTAFVLNIARHLAVEEKEPVGIFSVEMSKEELVDRLLVRQADIDAWKLKTGRLEEEDFTRLSDAMGILAEAPLFIDDTPAISVLEMRTKARRLQVEQGLKLIIVDYLQLVRGRQLENRVQEVSEISMGLKNLARELKLPVLAVSQLSRAVEVRGGARPRLADLRESGCLTEETQIMRADTGELVTIKDLAETKEMIPVFSLGEDLKLKVCQLIKAFQSGKKKVYRLILRSGKEIRASANHPFYALFGWKRLDQLRIGERIAVPRIIPLVQKPLDPPEERLVLLAHFIGDGCYLKHQPCHYTSGNLANLRAVEKAGKEGFGLFPRKIKQENWYHLYFSGNPKEGIKNPLIQWFKDLGIYNQHSWEKEIPRFIFTLPLPQIALFLSHLWATDGNFSQASEGGFALYFASTSQKLVSQVQHLLLRFGICSRIRKTKKAGYREGYIVDISGKTEQLKFLKNIGIYGKKEQVRKAIEQLEKIKANPNLDVIPKEVWQLIEEERKRLGLSTREFHRRLKWAYSGTQRHKNGVSRQRLAHITTILENDYLKNLSSSDLYWDEVLAIKEEGEEEVFDATVSGTHNFLANDVIVHNSIEQDADVVVFLYREEEETPENVTAEIAKHRNGPTGSFKLRFLPARISFYGMEVRRAKE
ncbi:MAG: replicative DNA helicase [Patescibacteria group bacterium]